MHTSRQGSHKTTKLQGKALHLHLSVYEGHAETCATSTKYHRHCQQRDMTASAIDKQGELKRYLLTRPSLLLLHMLPSDTLSRSKGLPRNENSAGMSNGSLEGRENTGGQDAVECKIANKLCN
eukprot:1151426-Pelagomonas_calceolata.AAC.5